MAQNCDDRVKALNSAKNIARCVLEEGCDPLLACRDLAQLRHRLFGVSDEIMNVFVGVPKGAE